MRAIPAGLISGPKNAAVLVVAGRAASIEVVSEREDVPQRAVLFVPAAKDAGDSLQIRTALAKVARDSGLEVVGLVEQQLGRAGARSSRAALLLTAHRGGVEVVLLHSLASLGGTTHEVIETVMKLTATVEVRSVTEPWLNLSVESSRSFALWLLDRERERRNQVHREAQNRARSLGRNVGRPRVKVDLARAEALLASGMTFARVARACGCGSSTLRRALAVVPAPTPLVCSSPPAAQGAIQ